MYYNISKLGKVPVTYPCSYLYQVLCLCWSGINIELFFLFLLIIGAFGIDFTHDSGEGLEIVKKGLLKFGVIGFCPTVVTTTTSNYHRVGIVYFKIK